MHMQLLRTAVVSCLISHALAGHFVYSCSNYYLGNGLSDGSGELFVEAFCTGGEEEDGTARPSLCTRLRINDCYKNVNGALQPLGPDEVPASDLSATCDIQSCALVSEIWDFPAMTCQCRDDTGKWTESTVNLNDEVSNNGGYLLCGTRHLGTLDCLV